MELVAKDLKFIDEGNIVDRVSDSSKVNRTKSQVDSRVKLSQSKNRIKPSLTISQL